MEANKYKILQLYFEMHSRGIAESYIFLASHLFHKLHNLEKNICAFSAYLWAPK